MTYPKYVAAWLSSALLLFAGAAQAEGVSPVPSELEDAAGQIVLTLEDYEQRVLFLLDESGLPQRVMERFVLDHPVTEAEWQAICVNYENGPGLSADGQTAYALWTSEEIENTFGTLDAEAFGAFLDELQSEEAVYQTRTLEKTLYAGDWLTLRLDALHFSPAFGLALSCTAVNRYQKTPQHVLLSECVVDGLCLPLAMAKPLTIAPDGSQSFIVPVTDAGLNALYLMGVEDVGEIAVRYRILDEENQTICSALSKDIRVPGTNGVASIPAGDTLYEGFGFRVDCLDFDETVGSAWLLVEKTDDSACRALHIDAVFDGVENGYGQDLHLEKGQRAIVSFAANRRVGGVDIYCTQDLVNYLRAPMHLTLGSPAPMAAQREASEPLWTAEDCEIRFLGVSQEVFSDSDALLFECINRSERETVWLYPPYAYAYLDGVRMKMKTAGAVCYPGTRSTVAMVVPNLGAPDLSAYETLEITLGLYTLKGMHLDQRQQSVSLRTALR